MGEGLPVGCGGISFWEALEGVVAFPIGPTTEESVEPSTCLHYVIIIIKKHSIAIYNTFYKKNT